MRVVRAARRALPTWGGPCEELSFGRARTVDNPVYDRAGQPTNHNLSPWTPRPSTPHRDEDFRADLRERHLSTVSTVPVNTMRLDMDPTSMNFWTRPDLGTTVRGPLVGPLRTNHNFGTPAVRHPLRMAGCTPLAAHTLRVIRGRHPVVAGVIAGGEHP